MEDQGPLLLAVVLLFLIVSWLFVSLRCFVRIRIVKCFGADDYLMVLSLILNTLNYIFAIISIHYGLGKHISEMNLANIVNATKYLLLGELSYIACTAFIRLSIGMLLLRISPNIIYRYIIWISMVVITLCSAVTFLVNLLQCHPISFFWDRIPGKGTCISAITVDKRIGYPFSAVCILFDWMAALLPIPMLWNVQMTLKLKASILIILTLGVFASIATIVRFKFILGLNNDNDVLFTISTVAIWSNVETGIGIAAASTASFRPLFKYLKITGLSINSKGLEDSSKSNRQGSICPQHTKIESTITHTQGPSHSNNNGELISNVDGIQQTKEVDISYGV